MSKLLRVAENFSWLMAGLAFGANKPWLESMALLVLATGLATWNERNLS